MRLFGIFMRFSFEINGSLRSDSFRRMRLIHDGEILSSLSIRNCNFFSLNGNDIILESHWKLIRLDMSHVALSADIVMENCLFWRRSGSFASVGFKWCKSLWLLMAGVRSTIRLPSFIFTFDTNSLIWVQSLNFRERVNIMDQRLVTAKKKQTNKSSYSVQSSPPHTILPQDCHRVLFAILFI